VAGVRILFTGGGTGGHLYPALNIAAAARRLDPSTECFFVGSQRGIESRVLPESGYPYRLLPLEPLRRTRPWQNWRLLKTAPAVVSGVSAAFRAFGPSVVLGTGGYVAGPVLAWARLQRVPIVLQEQNAEPGLVTRLFSARAAQLYLGYPEAESRLKIGLHTEVHCLGNPVAIAEPGSGGPAFDWPEGRILLVMGGSQGARSINEKWLADLEAASKCAPGCWPENLSVVWITGPGHAGPIAEPVSALAWANRIHVVPFVPDLGRQLGHVTLAVSRAGAMSVAELCAAGCPAVLVPLSTAAADHQSVNARALAEVGAALALEERELEPGDLWNASTTLLGDPARLAGMAAAAKSRGRPAAAREIAAALLALGAAAA